MGVNMSRTDLSSEYTEDDRSPSTPEGVVRAYVAAESRSDLDGVLALFAGDAVVMGEGWETASGRAELREMFERVLAPSRFRGELRIDVDRVLEGDEFAVVQAQSTGTVTRLEYGATIDVPYRELFVLRRQGDGRTDFWMVAAYMFNSPAVER